MPQHLDALSQANRVRLERAQLKRDLKAGFITVSGIIEEMPPEIKNMTVYEMISAQERWGRVRTLKLLRKNGLSEIVKFGNLTERQKNLLMDEF